MICNNSIENVYEKACLESFNNQSLITRPFERLEKFIFSFNVRSLFGSVWTSSKLLVFSGNIVCTYKIYTVIFLCLLAGDV